MLVKCLVVIKLEYCRTTAQNYSQRPWSSSFFHFSTQNAMPMRLKINWMGFKKKQHRGVLVCFFKVEKLSDGFKIKY